MSKPEIARVPGSGHKTLQFAFLWQWPAVVKFWQYNWIDFTFIEIFYERNRSMGNCHEIRLALLGIGIGVSANFRRSDKLNRMIAQADQIKAGLRDRKSPEELGFRVLDIDLDGGEEP